MAKKQEAKKEEPVLEKLKEFGDALKHSEEYKEIEKILKKHPWVGVGAGVMIGLALSKLLGGDGKSP